MLALRGTDPNHVEEKDFQDSSPDKLSLHPPNNWPKSHIGLGLQFHRPLILFIITFSLYYYFGKGVLDHFSIFIYWAPALCQAGLEGREGRRRCLEFQLLREMNTQDTRGTGGGLLTWLWWAVGPVHQGLIGNLAG